MLPLTSIRSHWLSKALFGLVLAFVLFMALTPVPPPPLQTQWDKLNHALAFFVLMVMGCFVYPGSSTRRHLLVAAGLLTLGALIELAQWFVPGRSSEWPDLLADAVGVAVAWAAVSLGHRVARWVSGRRVTP